MAELSILKFEVDDKPLKAAQEKVEALAKALDKVADANDRVEKSEADKSKVTKSSGDVAQAAYEKFIDGALGGVGALEKLLKKQRDTLSFMQTGFSKGQSSVLAFAKSLGASADELTKLSDILDKQRALLGGDTFDKSIGGLKSLQREVDLARKANASFNQEGALTRKQLGELARDVERVSQQYKEQGKSATELQDAITKLTTDYKDAAAALRVEENAIKAKQAAQDQLLQSTERQISAQRQLRIEQEKNALIKQGFSSSAASTGATLLVDGVDRNLVGQILAQKKATDDLIASQRASATAARGIGTASEQAGDAAVQAFRNAVKAANDQAQAFARSETAIGKLQQQLELLRGGVSSTRAASNALAEYANNLRAAGLSADVVSAKLKEFAGVQQSIAAQLKSNAIADNLKNIFLGGGAVGLALTAIQTLKQLGAAYIETADTITNLRTRLNILSDGTINFNKEFKGLVDIANSSRVPIKDVSALFARLVPIMPTLGRGTKDAANVTEAFSKILLISGASATEASSALLQFSQALGKGKLDGDEFRSVAEATPEFLRILEKQLGVTRGELFKMAEDGKLTADVLVNVLGAALPDLKQKLADVPLTVSQAFTILKNNLTETVASFDQAAGISSAIASGIKLIADAIQAVNNVSPEFKQLLGLIVGLSSQLTFATTVKNAIGNFFKVDTNDISALDAAIAKQQKLLDQRKKAEEIASNNSGFYGQREYQRAIEGTVKAEAELAKLQEARLKLVAVDGRIESQLMSENNRKIKERTDAEKQYQDVISKLYGKGNQNDKALQESLASIQKQRELKLVSEKELNEQTIAIIKEYGPKIKKEREKQLSAFTPGSSPALSELQKQLSSELSLITQQEKTKQDILKAELDAKIITQGEYAKREIELSRSTSDALIAQAEKRKTESQSILEQQSTDLVKSFEKSVASFRGQKNESELVRKSTENLAKALQDLGLKYDTIGQITDDLKKKAIDQEFERQSKAILGVIKDLNVLRDEYKQIANEEERLAENRRRNAELEDKLRFASPEDAAVIKAQAEEYTRLTDQLNKTSKAYLDATEAAIKQRQAILDSGPPTDDQVEQLKKLEQSLLDVRTARDKLEGKIPEQVTAAGIAALDKLRKDEEAKLIVGVAGAIETGLFEGGKAGRKKLRDLIVAELRKPITVFIQASVRTLLDSAGITNTGSSGAGDIGSIFDKATKAFDNLSSFNSNVAGKIASGLEELGAKLLSSDSPFLQNIGSQFSDSFVQGASQFGAEISGAFAAVGISDLISGGFKTGIDGIVKAATAIGGAIYGPIAGVVAGAFNRLYGRKLADTGVQGTFGGARGFEGESFEFFKGGLLRSDKTKTSPLDEAVRQSLANTFKGIQTQVAVFATSLGLNAEAIESYTASIKISTKGLTEEQITEKFAEEFKRITEEISNVVLTANSLDITKIQQAGELISETLQRLSVSLLTVNPVLDLLNQKLLDTSLAGGKLASDIVGAFGTLEDFSRLTSSYYENFFSEQEKTANTIERLTEQFAGLNLSLPSTRDGFRQLVEAQDLTTESGRNTFAALLKLSDAFSSVTKGASSAAGSVLSFFNFNQPRNVIGEQQRESRILAEQANAQQAAEQQAAAQQAALQQRLSLENQLLTLQGNTVELRNRERNALDASNLALYDAIKALEDQKVAADNLSDAFDRARQEQQTIIDALQGFEDALREAYNSEVQSLEEVISKVGEFEDALRVAYDSQATSINATIDSLSNFKDQLKDIRSQIEQQFTEGNSVATRNRFFDVASAIRAGDTSQFGNLGSSASEYLQSSLDLSTDFVQYARDFAQVQLTLDSVERGTDFNLSVAELQLKELEKQVLGLITLETGVVTVEKAVKNLLDAQSAANLAQQQISELKLQVGSLIEIDQGTKSVQQAIVEFQEASAAANTATIIIAELNSQQIELLGDINESVLSLPKAIEDYKRAVESGTTLEQIAQSDRIQESSRNFSNSLSQEPAPYESVRLSREQQIAFAAAQGEQALAGFLSALRDVERGVPYSSLILDSIVDSMQAIVYNAANTFTDLGASVESLISLPIDQFGNVVNALSNLSSEYLVNQDLIGDAQSYINVGTNIGGVTQGTAEQGYALLERIARDSAAALSSASAIIQSGSAGATMLPSTFGLPGTLEFYGRNQPSSSEILAEQAANQSTLLDFLNGTGVYAQPFASGGAFANGIVNSPTMFNMGLMGEAGPEAIMPLSRLPGGSLGVRAMQGDMSELSMRLDMLVSEVRGMRSESIAGQSAIANNTGKVARILDRADNGDSINVSITDDTTLLAL